MAKQFELQEHVKWLEQKKEELQSQLAELKAQTEWIPVSEKNPTEDGFYEVTLACEKNEYLRSVKHFLIEKSGRDKDICGWEHKSVIAWKERSKPYTIPTAR